MPRAVYDAERRALAYRVWRDANRNISETARALNAEHGWPVARGTLTSWVEAEDWHGRADREAEQAERADEAGLMSRSTILADLQEQKDRYEIHLQRVASEGKVDNAATSAYANLLKVMLSVQDKIDAGAGRSNLELARDVLQAQGDFISKKYPQHAAAFLEILEPLGEHLADIYG